MQLFRISGPAATKITAFRADGSLVWTNAQIGTNYIVQTASSLAGGTNWVSYVQIPVTNLINTNQIIAFNPPSGMALIPAGSFTMGDNLDGESDAPVHTVYVSAFYMDKYDVTYALWRQVYNWAITHGYSFYDAGSGKAANHPVQTIDWYDCVKWCNARSEMEGRTPAYYTTSTQTTVYRTGEVSVDNSSVKWLAGYRLPTEAEWEKAARGGASGQRFPWGNTISWSQANYHGDPLSLDSYGYAYDFATAMDYDPAFSGGDSGVFPYTSPVNYFAPNGYGLYDMAGNVWQWCWDWNGTYGSGSDPRGPASGSYRVLRGGGWDYYAFDCRAAIRFHYDPYIDYDNIGFRSVLPPGQ
jgi:formylglycine-generating enzyme required for sulfatase activity